MKVLTLVLLLALTGCAALERGLDDYVRERGCIDLKSCEGGKP